MDDPREPRRRARRRDEILETARSLFEAEGIAAVSTNRIAAVAGISPGNLYYWFSDKAQIVRALFAQWSALTPVTVAEDTRPEDVLEFLWDRAPEQLEVGTKYGFLLRELLPLLHADPILAQAYRENLVRRVDALCALAERTIAAGLVRAPDPPSTVRDVVVAVWLVTETAGPFVAQLGTDVVGASPVDLTRAIVAPLLTAEGRSHLGLHAARED